MHLEYESLQCQHEQVLSTNALRMRVLQKLRGHSRLAISFGFQPPYRIWSSTNTNIKGKGAESYKYFAMKWASD